MANKRKSNYSDKPSSSQIRQSSYGNSPSGWFSNHLSRRQLGKGLAWTAGLGMAGLVLYQMAGDDEPEVTLDSLELQKKEGWNVGSTEKPLLYPVGVTPTDSTGQIWSALDPNFLISIYQPRDAKWQPFFVPTLLQSLSQVSLNKQVKLIRTGEMMDAYQRAEGLRSLIASGENTDQTLIISDLPGPASIAVGAALADTMTLVPVFDNWPHPLGVVRSHETLGAMAYYAREIAEKSRNLKDNAPAMMLLDGNRLSSYVDQDSQFDNRYLAKLPPAEQLKQRGIQQVIYLTKDQTQAVELDDINEDFVEWQKNGINVRMLRLSEFKPYDEPLTATNTATSPTPTSTVHRHYYYGGSPYYHWWFYDHYYYSRPRQVYIYSGGRNVPIPPPSSAVRPSFNPPSYRPVSRPTVFSASRVGTSPGATGVGKTKPSGFGRTSVRMGSNGRVSGVRSGRSGSYGRSGGSWFGG
ncbi:MAG: hypothetical protein AB7P14_14055 [Blastocatellales bacterium]